MLLIYLGTCFDRDRTKRVMAQVTISNDAVSALKNSDPLIGMMVNQTTANDWIAFPHDLDTSHHIFKNLTILNDALADIAHQNTRPLAFIYLARTNRRSAMMLNLNRRAKICIHLTILHKSM